MSIADNQGGFFCFASSKERYVSLVKPVRGCRVVRNGYVWPASAFGYAVKHAKPNVSCMYQHRSIVGLEHHGPWVTCDSLGAHRWGVPVLLTIFTREIMSTVGRSILAEERRLAAQPLRS